jgi:hypothetical protein
MSRGALQTSIDVPPLCVRAAVSTVNDEARTVELIFSTGAAVERYDWGSGKRYREVLSLKPEHIDLGRMNNGAPLLDAHSAWSIHDQIGVVEPNSVRLTAKEARATVRFSKREAVEPIWQDVKDGVIRSVSVGYRVHRFEEDTPKDGSIPTRVATRWEPFEVSLVPMPADAGAQTRGDERRADTNQCVLVTQERAMADEQVQERTDGQSEFLRTENPLAAQPAMRLRAEPEEPQEPTDAERGATAEQARITGILDACDAVRLPRSFARELIDQKVPLVDAQTRIFNEVRDRVDPPASRNVPHGGARRAELTGEDPFIMARSGIENALLNRVNGEKFKLEDKGRQYRGMSMLDIAKAFLSARGVRVTEMGRMELAGVALGITAARGAMHTTSDFAYLLADVANKSLRADYEAAPQTFMPFTRIGSVPDFKTANRVQIGDAPALKPVLEHGEFTRGTIEEGREQLSAATYGRVFAITRQALVNDDTDAFARVPAKFGRMARNLESDLVYYQLLNNANMGDSNALFSAAHLNYQAAGDIDVTNISTGATAMMMQKGLDATTLVPVDPKFLIVPPAKMTLAMQFVSQNMLANTRDNINPWAGRLQVIVEPRLQSGVTLGSTTVSGSAYAWYLAGDKSQIDIIELVYLEGQAGPVIESRVGFDIDGLEIKCRLDVGAKALDWRGLYKSDGSDNS